LKNSLVAVSKCRKKSDQRKSTNRSSCKHKHLPTSPFLNCKQKLSSQYILTTIMMTVVGVM
jgi:hypothetical protein